MTRAISAAQVTATCVANMFFDHWIATYVIPDRVLADNDLLFVNEFSLTVCKLVALKDKINTAYDPQTSSQEVKR